MRTLERATGKARLARSGGTIGLAGTGLVALLLAETMVALEAPTVFLVIAALVVAILAAVHLGCIRYCHATWVQKAAPALMLLWLMWPVAEAAVHLYAATQPDLNPGPGFSQLLPKYRPHPYLAYVPTPGWTSTDGKSRHNSLGFRGAEVESERKPGSIRVLLLGGSTTYDEWIYDDAQTWAAQLQAGLQAEHPDRLVEVINGGASGYSSTESLLTLCLRGVDLKPDVAILYHSCNDAHTRMVDPQKYTGDGAGFRRVWDSQQAARWSRGGRSLGLRLSAILRLIAVRIGHIPYTPLFAGIDRLTIQPDTYAITPDERIPGRDYDRLKLLELNPPIYFERDLRSFVGVCRAHRITPVLTTWVYSRSFNDYMSAPSYRRAIEEQNEIARRLAEELKGPMIDFAVSGLDEHDAYWLESRHMTPEGSAAKARFTLEAIQAAGVLPSGQG